MTNAAEQQPNWQQGQSLGQTGQQPLHAGYWQETIVPITVQLDDATVQRIANAVAKLLRNTEP